MHWNATDERYNEALRRLAAVMLMLAGIAERAVCRSWPVRPLLFWLLALAEKRARGFAERLDFPPLPQAGLAVLPLVAAEANPPRVRGGVPPAARENCEDGASATEWRDGSAPDGRAAPQPGVTCSGEAARLALAFHALAVFFFALALQAPRWLRPARQYRGLPGNDQYAVMSGGLPFAYRSPYADTS
jgi:hypothetical protein